MKKKIYLFVLFTLIGLFGNSMHVLAQEISEPTAQWDFNNPDALMTPVKGNLTMVPAKTSRGGITFTTLSDAGITSVAGPSEDNKAILIPKNSALKVERAEGAQPSTTYTIMMDVMVENATPFDGLLQTDKSNGSDGDLFINKNSIGVASMGGYFGKVKNNTWTRIVLSYRDGKNILYQDGKKLTAANPDVNDRFKIQSFGFYLFCDEDGEEEPTYVANVAFWETPLTDDEVSALGGYKEEVKNFEIATANDLVSFAEYISSGKEANGVLTADINLTEPWTTPIGIDGASFIGTFDGQGHKITGFNGTSSGKFGLFGVTSNATIKNFSIDGKLKVTAAHGSGAIGWASSSRISNVHSTLEITVEEPDVHHVGGVVGSAQYKNRITGCTFAGTLEESANNNDCFGGVIGYMAEDTVLFCANYGTVTYSNPGGSVGGIAAYLNNNGGMIRGCLNVGKVALNDEETKPTLGGAIMGNLRGHTPENMQSNCWLEDSAPFATGGNVMPDVKCFTSDKMATGEVCYALNGDQTNIGWFQTLGSDESPVLDPTHQQVYLKGRKHCDGSLYEESTYANSPSEVTQDEHNFVDGYCSYCDLFDNNFTLTPNAEGIYEIGSVNQLRRFAALVNSGELKSNAILTADIDFAGIIEATQKRGKQFTWTPIGSWASTPAGNACFQGHFDGQGHTIKNFNVNSSQNFFGLFGVISTDCLIENFSIEGTINTTTQYTGGVAAYARDARVVFRNLRCNVNIKNTSVGGRQGGILGTVQTTEDVTLIENCTYSGTLDANDNGGGGNYGGMVGYVNSNANSIAEINNCLFDGTLVNSAETPGGCTFGGMVGYVSGGVTHINSSLAIGEVNSPVSGQFFGAVKSNKSTMLNCYYRGEMVNGSASTFTLTATQVSEDQLASGEVCWLLNEENFVDVAWHQVLNEQEYPVPDGTDGIVYMFGDGDYKCLNDALLPDLIIDLSAKEEEFLDEVVAYQPLIDEYEEVIESWQSIETLDKLFEAYKAARELKKSIKTSADNYAAYTKACEDAGKYIEDNGLEGEYTDFLKTYLEDSLEPDANYPNGTHDYIIENHILDDKALAAEIIFVNKMLENAIAGGSTPGTEITRLLKNANFAEGYEGWTTEFEGGTATVGGTPEIMPIPEGFNNRTFNAYQTITELPNGIYMLTANSLFRTGGDIYSTFYAGQLYLNNTCNYVMSPGEDVIYEHNAEVGVNCLGEGSDSKYESDDIVGWVPNVREGCSVAFNAGRYLNLCATEVTDGQLTIGARNLGTGLGSDWLPFGNLHIYYLGTAEEADEKLAEVLKGYVARAQVILNFESSSYTDEFNKHPNMSEELKGKIAEAIGDVEKAKTGSDKIKLIETFSDLFNQTHACRMAYIEMLKAVIKLQDNLYALVSKGLIADDVYEEWSTKLSDALDHYTQGDVSADEAIAITEELNNNDIMLKSVDGVYQLETAADLAIFAMIVNSGSLDANAVLMKDIDLSELGEEYTWTPIGNWSSNGIAYKGHFDGQGHTISNFTSSADQNFFGLFGVISDNVVIENFNIYGDITSAYQYQGSVAGYARDNNLTVRNIHSYVNVTNTSVGGRAGGILGCAMDGSTHVEKCTYSGTLDGYDDGNGGNYGGIVGYTNNSTNAVCDITDCLFDGKLINTVAVPGNCTFGGMVGYTNSSLVTIKNCLSIGTVESARYAQFFGALNGTNSKIYNSYYKGDYINGTSSGQKANPQEAILVTDEQLASGEICYKLNGDAEVPAWYQTLTGEDNDLYPVLDPTHKVVLYDGTNGYYNEGDEDPDGIETVNVNVNDNIIYNLSGQRMSKLQKGINIVNGKKIAIK